MGGMYIIFSLAVRTMLIWVQSSQNCWDQASVCYATAGPTGSRNCYNWEAYCDAVKSACGSGNFNGPPSCKPYQPPPPSNLSEAESAPSADVPADDGSTYVPVPPAASEAAPAESSPTQTSDGSIDTCGNRGGLTCKTGLCCSSNGYVLKASETHLGFMLTVHRYCGTSSDYCGDGCQSAFGACGSSKHRREHKRHGHPHMK